MPPKRAASAGSTGAAKKKDKTTKGGGATATKKKKKGAKGAGDTAVAAAPPREPTPAELIAAVPIPKPFIAPLMEHGSALFSLAASRIEDPQLVEQLLLLSPSSTSENGKGTGAGAGAGGGASGGTTAAVGRNPFAGNAAAATSAARGVGGGGGGAAMAPSSPPPPPPVPASVTIVAAGTHDGTVLLSVCPQQQQQGSEHTTGSENNNNNNNGTSAFGGGGRRRVSHFFDDDDGPTGGGAGGAASGSGGENVERLRPVRTDVLPAHHGAVTSIEVLSGPEAAAYRPYYNSAAAAAAKKKNSNALTPTATSSATKAASPLLASSLSSPAPLPLLLRTASADGTICVWSLPSCDPLVIFTADTTAAASAPPRPGSAAANTPTPTSASGGTQALNAVVQVGTRLYAGDDAGYVHFWDLAPAAAPVPPQNQTQGHRAGSTPQQGTAGTSVGSGLPSPRQAGDPAAAAVPTLPPTLSLRAHHGRITAMTVPSARPDAPDAGTLRPNTILTASDDGLVKLLNVGTRTVHAVYSCESAGLSSQEPAEPCLCVAYIHPRVFAGCADGSIQVFDAPTAQRVGRLSGHTDAVAALRPVDPPKDPWAASLAAAVPTTRAQVADHQQLGVSASGLFPFFASILAPMLLSCGDDRSIILWDPQCLSPLYFFAAPTASLSRFRRRPGSALLLATAAGSLLSPQSPPSGGKSGAGRGGGGGASPAGPRRPSSATSSNFVTAVRGGVAAAAAASMAEDDGPLPASGCLPTPYHRHNVVALALVAAPTVSPLPHATTGGSGSGAAAAFGGGHQQQQHAASGLQLLSACYGGRVLSWNCGDVFGAMSEKARIASEAAAVVVAAARRERQAADKKKGGRR